MQLSSIPGSDKLPSNTVNQIFQDSQGYIWIGTPEGLCRYDGYRILNIKHSASSRLPGSDNITSIKEAGEYLLIGTDAGLQLLDKKTYRLQPFPDKRLQERRVKSILVDKGHDIWIGTEGPVLVYNADFTLKKIYDQREIPNSGASSIYEDADGNIWICFWNSGLYRFNKKDSSIKAFPKIGENNNPFKIFQDNRKNYWICTWGNGLFLFDPRKDSGEMYKEVEVRSRRKQSNKEELFYSVLQDDQQGYVWVMSFSGITAFKYAHSGNIKEADVSHLFTNTNNVFSDLYKDLDGNLWIAAFGDGILTVNFNKPFVLNYTFDEIKRKYGLSANFTMLYADRQGRMWFDMDRLGFGFFDIRTKKPVLYSDYPSLSKIKALSSVSCAIVPRGTNQVWTGSTYLPVITVISLKQNRPEVENTFNLRDYDSNSGNPLSFFEDSRNNLWVTTTNGILVRPSGQNNLLAINSVTGRISGITEDSSGDIWIATSWNGLYKISQKKESLLPLRIIHFKNVKGIADPEIRSISADSHGNIWIASGAGKIAWYQTSAGKFYTYNKFASSEKILTLTCDKNNHIWVSTSRLVYRITPFKKFREYAADDGFTVKMLARRAYAESQSDDQIYFGGTNGISVFSTSTEKEMKNGQHKPVITDIKINNASITDIAGREHSSEAVVLEPEDRNLEIDFSSLNYEFPGKIQYAYKLEGVDADWVYPGKGRRFAVYNNLSKGRYTFMVKASGPENVWSEDAVRLIIDKKPAYYESNAAYTFYLALIGAMIYAGFRFATYRLKLRSDLRIARIEREKTEELAQAKISYFTGISHDFLTPLTIISCLIDDIQITTKRNLPQYEKMRSNVNRLKRLLQQVLDFRRIESGNMFLKISRGDIIAFIKEISLSNFMPLAKKKEINFSIDTTISECDAYFDADKIDKILFNILSNAFKYTPKGGKISISLSEERYMLHDFLVMRVADSGPGISQAEQEKIFTPFYNNSKNRNESNGIGLSLTKNLVEIHQGSIDVVSEPNMGSVFTVRIPTGPESYADQDLKEATEIIREDNAPDYLPAANNAGKSSLDGAGKPDRLNLLLVDDNEDLLLTVENILREYYNVYTATDGLQALEVIKSNETDIIVSDVMMPGMDGLQLCRHLKNDINTSHIPVILLTAKNSVDDRVECYNAGANGYIAKPFELKILVARINNFLANKQNKQSGFKSSYDINISVLDQPSLDEHFLKNTIETIEQHLTETDFDVVALAGHLNMSRSTLYRKIKVLVGLSPNEFIKNIRLKHACQMMMKDKSVPVSEVAFSTGFSDPRYFATCFKAEFGLTPSEYQKGNNVQA